MKKLFAIILVCCMLLGAATPIAAMDAGSAIQPRFTYIDEVSATIIISNLGVAHCDGLIATRTLNPVKLVIRLQELDGSNWMTIKKWEITGTSAVTDTKSYAVYSGSHYRVKVTGYVYDEDGNLLEYASAYSYMDY